MKRCVAVVAVQNPIGEKVKTKFYIYIYKYNSIFEDWIVPKTTATTATLQRFLSKRLIYNNINHKESIIYKEKALEKGQIPLILTLNAKAMFHLVSGKPTKQSIISFGTDTTEATIINSTLIYVAA